MMDICELDKKYSYLLTIQNGRYNPAAASVLRFLCKILEWSCHGVPWFIFAAIRIYTTSESLREIYTKLFIFLVIDVIVIAILKLTFKRPRPHYNENNLPLSISMVDGYSFPSGHTTRAVMLYLLILRYDIFVVAPWVLICWVLAVSLSRVILGRHYVSDVVVGAIVGAAETIAPLILLGDMKMNMFAS